MEACHKPTSYSCSPRTTKRVIMPILKIHKTLALRLSKGEKRRRFEKSLLSRKVVLRRQYAEQQKALQAYKHVV